MSENYNINAVIRFSSMGDILLTLPFLDEMLKRTGTKSLDYFTKKIFTPLIAYHPVIRNVIDLESFDSALDLRQFIKKESYSRIYDLHNSLRSRHITLFLKNVRRYKKYKFQRFLLTRLKIFPRFYLHAGQKYMKLLENNPQPRTSQIPLPPLNEIRPENKVMYEKLYLSKSVLGISLGASKPSKMYPPEKMSRLLAKIENQFEHIIFIGHGRSEEKLVRGIIKKNSTKCTNLVSRLTLGELLLFTKTFSLFIGNDSGPSHVAAMNGVPTLTIFGQTVPQYGFTPVGTTSIAEPPYHLTCRPCGHLGRETCPLTHHDCMELIHPDYLIEKMKEIYDISV